MSGRYTQSFKAYYEFFVCVKAPLYEGLSPSATDSGVNVSLAGALKAGYAADYVTAAALLRRGIAQDERFDEGRYFLGNLLWAAGDKSGAERAWKSAVRGPFFPQAPDDRSTPEPAIAAGRMLRLHRISAFIVPANELP